MKGWAGACGNSGEASEASNRTRTDDFTSQNGAMEKTRQGAHGGELTESKVAQASAAAAGQANVRLKFLK
jgi:hypothetical protein